MTLKSIFRIIRRDLVSLITNVTGLSLGLAASVLLSVFIRYELSFDKHFSNSDRIYRLNTIWAEAGDRTVIPINLRRAYTEIPEETAGIETAIQVYQGGR